MRGPEGAFTIAAVEGVTLTKWTRAWDERMPDVPLSVVRTTATDQIEALADRRDSAEHPQHETQSEGVTPAGRADVAFVRLPVEAEGLSVIPLYEEAAYVVVPKDHPVTAFDSVVLADLAGETMLEGGWASAIELVGANVGVVVVPQSIARLHARADVVAREVTDAPTTRIALVWPEDRTTEAVEAFVGIVRGRTARSSRSGTGEADGETARRGDVRSSAPAKGAVTSRGAGGRPSRSDGRTQRQSAAEARAAANRRKRTRGK